MKNQRLISETNLESYTDRTKKSEKANLENKKAIFFQIGLIISLSIALFAFEWKTYDKSISEIIKISSTDVPYELPPITEREKPEPKIEKQNLTLLNVVDDLNKVKDEFDPFKNFDETKTDEPFIPVTKLPDPEPEIDEIFIVVENQPEFIGGEKALFDYLAGSIKYPTIAREAGIQGTVYISFIVEKDGSISNVTVARGISGGCDEEAVRVIKSMPNWKAGLQRNKPVRVQFNVPIKFTLSN